jgi:hypothetical protein
MKHWSRVAAVSACALLARTARAEVTLAEPNGWQVFTTGSVGAFLTFANGDGFPKPPANDPTRAVIPGAGLPTETDSIPNEDATGQPIPDDQGKLSKWRVRSGYQPNILGLGVRTQLAPELKLKAFVAVWGTIESVGQRKYWPIQADFHEAYLNFNGSWGSVTAGRTLSLFSRGIAETELLYGHRYGVGFQPSVSNPGPTGGLIGFGVLAAAYNPGIYYSTPSLGGISASVGLFDPTRYDNSWNRTETPRPEAELAYDLAQGAVKLHVYVNCALQKLYINNNAKDHETLYGASGGLRFEAGPFHVGGGGYVGRGVGMFYAFDDTAGGSVTNGELTLVGPQLATDPVTMAQVNKTYELRTFDGFAAFAQYSAAKCDFNVGVGQSRAHELAIDKLLFASLIETQTGISAGVVWHVSKNLHADFDYMRAMFRWYKGQKQDVNFFNAGATIDW